MRACPSLSLSGQLEAAGVHFGADEVEVGHKFVQAQLHKLADLTGTRKVTPEERAIKKLNEPNVAYYHAIQKIDGRLVDKVARPLIDNPTRKAARIAQKQHDRFINTVASATALKTRHDSLPVLKVPVPTSMVEVQEYVSAPNDLFEMTDAGRPLTTSEAKIRKLNAPIIEYYHEVQKVSSRAADNAARSVIETPERVELRARKLADKIFTKRVGTASQLLREHNALVPVKEPPRLSLY